MIPTDRAEEVLSRMLVDSGFDQARPDPMIVWRVFREFAKVAFDCADDAFLFQCGVYNFTGRDLFNFDFTRQFALEEDGEYDHMEQLSCTLYFEPDATLERLEMSVWSSDFASTDAFFDRVLQLPEFVAIQGRAAIGCQVCHDQV